VITVIKEKKMPKRVEIHPPLALPTIIETGREGVTELTVITLPSTGITRVIIKYDYGLTEEIKTTLPFLVKETPDIKD
jgi:hypothetical protein